MSLSQLTGESEEGPKYCKTIAKISEYFSFYAFDEESQKNTAKVLPKRYNDV